MTRSLVLAAALLFFAGVASASNFPYARCEVGDMKTPFGVANDIMKKDGAYCFTIEKDSSCSGDCCDMDVKKFEIDVEAGCKADTTVSATVNGRSVPASFVVPPNAPNGVMTVKVDNLGLTHGKANGAEICITLGGGCDSIDKFCAEEGTTCEVALGSSDHACCPVSLVGMLVPPEFPFCECVSRPMSTPFKMSPAMAKGPGTKPGTTAYCFDITTVEPDNEGTCGKTTVLKKLEFYADHTKKWEVSAITVKTKSGVSGRANTWASGDEDTFKVTPLNWSIKQVEALSPSICIELKDSTKIEDFCMGGACWATLFDTTQTCCPMFPARY